MKVYAVMKPNGKLVNKYDSNAIYVRQGDATKRAKRTGGIVVVGEFEWKAVEVGSKEEA